ncbi:MAG: TetR/AcrR family transcriptional regulator [Burkholderiaceae bacterium]
MKKSISEATRQAVLEAAWRRMSRPGGVGAGMGAIAQEAGVSRQTVFYAFGGRSGLLVAMVRHRDQQTDHVHRLSSLAQGPGADLSALLAFIDVWLDYLPIVHPVAVQLENGAPSDPDLALAWNDRFFNQGLRRGFELILGRMTTAGCLPKGSDPSRMADLCLSLVVPSAWQLLVHDCRWTPDQFRSSRHVLIRGLLAGA